MNGDAQIKSTLHVPLHNQRDKNVLAVVVYEYRREGRRQLIFWLAVIIRSRIELIKRHPELQNVLQP